VQQQWQQQQQESPTKDAVECPRSKVQRAILERRLRDAVISSTSTAAYYPAIIGYHVVPCSNDRLATVIRDDVVALEARTRKQLDRRNCVNQIYVILKTLFVSNCLVAHLALICVRQNAEKNTS